MGRLTGANNVAQLFPSAAPGVSPEDVRIAEALVFAAAEPLEESAIAQRLSEGADVAAVMEELRRLYDGRGVNLVQVAQRWMFRTADDLAWALARDRDEKRKLSRAALETLAIVAYHQPVTRADIEQIRGVAVSKGALDVLMESRWVRMRGRRSPTAPRPTFWSSSDSTRLRICLASMNSRAPDCSKENCRPAMTFPNRMTHRRSGRTRSRSKTPRLSKPGRPSPQKKTDRQTRVFPAWRALTVPQKRGQCAGS